MKYGYCFILLFFGSSYPWYARQQQKYIKTPSSIDYFDQLALQKKSFEDMYQFITNEKLDIYTGGTICSLLWWSIYRGHRDLALFLLSLGANANCRFNNATALDLAINQGDYILVLRALEGGAKCRIKNSMLARRQGHEHIAQLIKYTLQCRSKSKNTLRQLDKHGLSVMHYAIFQKNIPYIDALCISGVPIELADGNGKTGCSYLQETKDEKFISYFSYSAPSLRLDRIRL